MTSRLALLCCLIVVAGVLAGVLLIENQQPPAGSIDLLPDIGAADIKHLRISRADGQQTELTFSNDGWRMDSPYSVFANQNAASALAGLADYDSQGQFDAGEPSRFGLDKPAFRVQLNEVVVEYGTTNSLDGRRYVRVDDTVHLVVDRIYHHLLASPDGLIHPGLLYPGEKLLSVSVADWQLQRTEQGWRLNGPETDRSADQIHQLAQNWSQLQAVTIRKAEVLTGGPNVRIETDKRSLALSWQDTANGAMLINMDNGLAYHLSRDMVSRLSLP